MYRVGQKRIYTPYMTVYMVISLLYTIYDRVFGDFPAKVFRLYTVYIYGSGQPYI